MPPLAIFSLSVFTKMMFGALSGFEYVAIFAGETRNPARNLTRSVFITAPFIALIYIFATSSILAFVPPDAVDVLAPIPQALRLAARVLPGAAAIIPLAIVLLFLNYPTSFSVYFSASARLPMVAGCADCLVSGRRGRVQGICKVRTGSLRSTYDSSTDCLGVSQMNPDVRQQDARAQRLASVA